MADDDPPPIGPLSFLGRPLPSSFDVLAVTIAPGASRPYDEREWRDAIVVLERGELDVECRFGRLRHFDRGAVLHLVGLPLRTLHNRGTEPTVLVAVSRGARA